MALSLRRDADVTQVGIVAEALQQMLTQLKGETRGKTGFRVLKSEFDADAAVVEANVIKVPVENPWV